MIYCSESLITEILFFESDVSPGVNTLCYIYIDLHASAFV